VFAKTFRLSANFRGFPAFQWFNQLFGREHDWITFQSFFLSLRQIVGGRMSCCEFGRKWQVTTIGWEWRWSWSLKFGESSSWLLDFELPMGEWRWKLKDSELWAGIQKRRNHSKKVEKGPEWNTKWENKKLFWRVGKLSSRVRTRFERNSRRVQFEAEDSGSRNNQIFASFKWTVACFCKTTLSQEILVVVWQVHSWSSKWNNVMQKLIDSSSFNKV
jgi:hypothetical protein